MLGPTQHLGLHRDTGCLQSSQATLCPPARDHHLDSALLGKSLHGAGIWGLGAQGCLWVRIEKGLSGAEQSHCLPHCHHQPGSPRDTHQPEDPVRATHWFEEDGEWRLPPPSSCLPSTLLSHPSILYWALTACKCLPD